MRASALHLALAATVAAPAQPTTHSVQHGDWDDPSTWDCGCIPEVHNAVVQHQVRIAGNTFLMQRVHVLPVGSLVMDLYFSVAIMDTVINDGLMDLVGDIDVDWVLLNNSLIRIQGVIHNDASLVMGGPGAQLHTDDLGNYGAIEGEGRICVGGFSENTGSIHGLIDFCDLTPTVGQPPYIDVNSGTVGGSVTFCAAGDCWPLGATHRAASPGARLWPNPAGDALHVEAEAGAVFELRDPSGRVALSTAFASSGAQRMPVGQLPAGLYVAQLSVGAQRIAWRLALAR